MKKADLIKFISNTNKSNITEKMLAVPSHIYDVYILVENLEYDLRQKQNELTTIESKFFRDISTTYKNVKTMTSTTISHHINCKPEVITKKQEIVEAQKKLGLVKAKLKALSIFSEMLTNVGHNYRMEKKTINKGV